VHDGFVTVVCWCAKVLQAFRGVLTIWTSEACEILVYCRSAWYTALYLIADACLCVYRQSWQHDTVICKQFGFEQRLVCMRIWKTCPGV